MIEKLFNYRPKGLVISTNKGDKILMVIRKGPRGIVAVTQEEGPIVLWNNEECEDHLGDLEAELIQKTIDKINL